MEEWKYQAMVMEKTISNRTGAVRDIYGRVSITDCGFGLCGHAMGLVGASFDRRAS